MSSLLQLPIGHVIPNLSGAALAPRSSVDARATHSPIRQPLGGFATRTHEYSGLGPFIDPVPGTPVPRVNDLLQTVTRAG